LIVMILRAWVMVRVSVLRIMLCWCGIVVVRWFVCIIIVVIWVCIRILCWCFVFVRYCFVEI